VLQQRYKDKVEFVLVYIREAHATDGWSFSNGSHVADPANLEERKNVAKKCRREFDLDFTAVVD
jgi:hypothetical protein